MPRRLKMKKGGSPIASNNRGKGGGRKKLLGKKFIEAATSKRPALDDEEKNPLIGKTWFWRRTGNLGKILKHRV